LSLHCRLAPGNARVASRLRAARRPPRWSTSRRLRPTKARPLATSSITASHEGAEARARLPRAGLAAGQCLRRRLRAECLSRRAGDPGLKPDPDSADGKMAMTCGSLHGCADPARSLGPLVNGRHPHPGLQLGGDVLVVLADRRPGHLPQPGVSQSREPAPPTPARSSASGTPGNHSCQAPIFAASA
jgi:hypothetical protein